MPPSPTPVRAETALRELRRVTVSMRSRSVALPQQPIDATCAPRGVGISLQGLLHRDFSGARVRPTVHRHMLICAGSMAVIHFGCGTVARTQHGSDTRRCGDSHRWLRRGRWISPASAAAPSTGTPTADGGTGNGYQPAQHGQYGGGSRPVNGWVNRYPVTGGIQR